MKKKKELTRKLKEGMFADEGREEMTHCPKAISKNTQMKKKRRWNEDIHMHSYYDKFDPFIHLLSTEGMPS